MLQMILLPKKTGTSNFDLLPHTRIPTDPLYLEQNLSDELVLVLSIYHPQYGDQMDQGYFLMNPRILLDPTIR